MTPTRIIILTALLLCVVACKPTTTTHEESQSQIAELKTQIAELNSQISYLTKEISNIGRELDSTKKVLADLQMQSADAQAKAVQAATISAESARRDAAQKIYRELIKLNAATESGITYVQYSERVLNAKTEIESAALALDDDTVRQSSLRVLDAYQAARDFWSKGIGRSSSYPRFTEFEQLRFKRYGIEFNSDGKAGMEKVSVFWANAQIKLKDLGDYLKLKGLL